MKILHIDSFLPPYGPIGGSGLFVLDLIEYLQNQGHKSVTVSTYHKNVSEPETTKDVKHYRIGIKNLYWPGESQSQNYLYKYKKPIWHTIDTYNPLMSLELKKIIEKERPDIINTHTLSGFSVSVWKTIRRMGIPLMHTIHDHYLLCPKGYMYNNGNICINQCFKCKLLAYPRKILSNYVDGVCAVSHYILDKHISNGYFRFSKTRNVIYSSYDIPKSRINLESNGQKIKLGYLGSLYPQKGIELLLENIPEDLELFVAGKGNAEYENNLKTKFNKPNIHFMGFVKPEKIFNKIDVLVFPSLMMEALGRGIIEAYTNGIPVIASRRGGIPEIVDEGRTGRIFDPNRPEELIAIFKELSDNPGFLKNMKKYVIEKAKLFSKEINYGKYLGIYKELMQD